MSEIIADHKPFPLTDAEERFAAEYAVSHNIIRAFLAAEPVHQNSGQKQITKRGRAYFNRPHVQAKIRELTDYGQYQTGFSLAEAVGMALAIFNADPNELISIRVGCCRHCHGEDHGYQWREDDYLKAIDEASLSGKRLPDIGGGFGFDHTAAPHPDCPRCGGEGVPRDVVQPTEHLSPAARLLFNGVKRTKDGLQILTLDRMKALELACKLAGLLKPEGSPTVNVNTQVNAVSAIVDMKTTDPIVAAKAYMEMITGQVQA